MSNPVHISEPLREVMAQIKARMEWRQKKKKEPEREQKQKIKSA